MACKGALSINFIWQGTKAHVYLERPYAPNTNMERNGTENLDHQVFLLAVVGPTLKALSDASGCMKPSILLGMHGLRLNALLFDGVVPSWAQEVVDAISRFGLL